LSKNILTQYDNTAEGMHQSALPLLDIAQSENFETIVLLLKSSNVSKIVEDHHTILPKLDKFRFNFPIRLGVKETRNGTYVRPKNAIGLTTLLPKGIGDMIRVSLTEDPIAKIAAAYHILQSCEKQFKHVEYIACPCCGRTQFDIQHIFNEIKEKISYLNRTKIAITGCIINGIGEIDDADFGYRGTDLRKITMYHGNPSVKSHAPSQMLLDLRSRLSKFAGNKIISDISERI
jgi:(E)-4-hydroxy-3-methylbut-2-enyl-diphosphate synthase